MTHRQDSSRLASRLRGRLVAALLVGFLLVAGAAPAIADDYDPKRSGHPLRIVAYVVHPVGVLIDFILLRPAHWIGSQAGFRTIFGHDEKSF